MLINSLYLEENAMTFFVPNHLLYRFFSIHPNHSLPGIFIQDIFLDYHEIWQKIKIQLVLVSIIRTLKSCSLTIIV